MTTKRKRKSNDGSRSSFTTESSSEVVVRRKSSRTQRPEVDRASQPSVRRKRVELVPRNFKQEAYLRLLQDQTNDIVFAMGPAGTGKTMLAAQFAIKQLQEGFINKIVITRPAVSVDEDHGFLPGTLLEKMAPWVIPIMDVFKEHFTPAQVEQMILDEQIEIAPLAFMRGRTLKDSIILFDEAQNATPNQMKMMLTRIGHGSKIVVTGDIQQHDRGFEDNGLKDVITRVRNRRPHGIAMVEFNETEIERHPVVEEVLSMYDDEGV